MQPLFSVPPEHNFWLQCVFAKQWIALDDIQRDILTRLGWHSASDWDQPDRGAIGRYWYNFTYWSDLRGSDQTLWVKLGFSSDLWDCFDHPHHGLEAALHRRHLPRYRIHGVEHFCRPLPRGVAGAPARGQRRQLLLGDSLARALARAFRSHTAIGPGRRASTVNSGRTAKLSENRQNGGSQLIIHLGQPRQPGKGRVSKWEGDGEIEGEGEGIGERRPRCLRPLRTEGPKAPRTGASGVAANRVRSCAPDFVRCIGYELRSERRDQGLPESPRTGCGRVAPDFVRCIGSELRSERRDQGRPDVAVRKHPARCTPLWSPSYLH